MFTLRVLIHYREAEARSVTLSRWRHLHSTERSPLHCTAANRKCMLAHTHARTHAYCNCSLWKKRWIVPSASLSPKSCCKIDKNKQYSYTYCTPNGAQRKTCKHSEGLSLTFAIQPSRILFYCIVENNDLLLCLTITCNYLLHLKWVMFGSVISTCGIMTFPLLNCLLSVWLSEWGQV